MRISDWSSDVCSSDLGELHRIGQQVEQDLLHRARVGLDLGKLDREAVLQHDDAALGAVAHDAEARLRCRLEIDRLLVQLELAGLDLRQVEDVVDQAQQVRAAVVDVDGRSEEHTSELQSLMRISYAVFCLKKKKQ